MLVMSTKPSSYICAESSELPQPTTRTRPPAGRSGVAAACPGASALTAARSSGRSCAHSLYHSNGTAPRCSAAALASERAARRLAKPCLFEEAVPIAQAAELLELVWQKRSVAWRRRSHCAGLRWHGSANARLFGHALLCQAALIAQCVGMGQRHCKAEAWRRGSLSIYSAPLAGRRFRQGRLSPGPPVYRRVSLNPRYYRAL